ncbi:hypothetical protein [Streptomyces sp. NPDC023588]|uniref:hypothetical protein n=1 Tax=Streptomyces sp. NPDC023588 TaxID=3154907 RepID=UPI0033F5E46A
MSTEPRPATDVERELVELALRIVTDIARMDALTSEHPTARVGCSRNTLKTAENLYIQAEQAATWSRDPDLIEKVAKVRPPEAW